MTFILMGLDLGGKSLICKCNQFYNLRKLTFPVSYLPKFHCLLAQSLEIFSRLSKQSFYIVLLARKFGKDNFRHP
jgi:hypothetical protein